MLSKFKRFARMAFGVACATALVTCALSASAFAADEDAYFTVKAVGANGTETVVKEYTQQQLEDLATEGTLKGQFYKGDAWHVYTTTKYVTFEKIFEDAQLTVNEYDSVAAGSKYTSTWQVAKSGQFYGATTNDSAAVQGEGVDVEPAIALNATLVDMTSGSCAEPEGATTELGAAKLPMAFYGITSDGTTGGNRFWTGTNSLTVTSPYFYVQNGQIIAKTYSKSDFEALATEGTLKGQFYKGDAWHVYTTTKYVTFEKLFEDAGIQVAPCANVAAGSKYTSTWAVAQSGQFYGATTNDSAAVQGEGVDVEPAIALNATLVDMTSGSCAEPEGATTELGAAKLPMAFYGITSDGTTGGNRFWTGTNSLAISDVAHAPVDDAAVAATCTKAGKTAGAHCKVCGEILTAQTEIAATGHTVVIDKAVAATYTATGKTAGSHCSVCKTVLKAQTTIAKLAKVTNPMKAKASKTKLAYKKTVTQKVTIKTTNAKGRVTYKVNAKAAKKGVKVSRYGKVTVKKGFKGTIYVYVKAAGTTKYKAKTIKLKIVVK